MLQSNNMIKNFEEFILEEKEQDFSNAGEIYKTEDDKIEKLDSEEWEVKKIIDVIKDPKEIEELENQLTEANVGVKLSNDLDAKDMKRGDIVYMTAILAPRNKSTAYSPGTIGVVKLRLIDLYYGLSKLKSIMR